MFCSPGCVKPASWADLIMGRDCGGGGLETKKGSWPLPRMGCLESVLTSESLVEDEAGGIDWRLGLGDRIGVGVQLWSGPQGAEAEKGQSRWAQGLINWM